jgi:hypothetical protein
MFSCLSAPEGQLPNGEARILLWMPSPKKYAAPDAKYQARKNILADVCVAGQVMTTGAFSVVLKKYVLADECVAGQVMTTGASGIVKEYILADECVAVQVITTGAFGIVKKGYDKRTGREVVIKILSKCCQRGENAEVRVALPPQAGGLPEC